MALAVGFRITTLGAMDPDGVMPFSSASPVCYSFSCILKLVGNQKAQKPLVVHRGQPGHHQLFLLQPEWGQQHLTGQLMRCLDSQETEKIQTLRLLEPSAALEPAPLLEVSAGAASHSAHERITSSFGVEMELKHKTQTRVQRQQQLTCWLICKRVSQLSPQCSVLFDLLSLLNLPQQTCRKDSPGFMIA